MSTLINARSTLRATLRTHAAQPTPGSAVDRGHALIAWHGCALHNLRRAEEVDYLPTWVGGRGGGQGQQRATGVEEGEVAGNSFCTIRFWSAYYGTMFAVCPSNNCNRHANLFGTNAAFHMNVKSNGPPPRREILSRAKRDAAGRSAAQCMVECCALERSGGELVWTHPDSTPPSS
eukprot:305809-Chlamydomonas_euryale.AAC.1